MFSLFICTRRFPSGRLFLPQVVLTSSQYRTIPTPHLSMHISMLITVHTLQYPLPSSPLPSPNHVPSFHQIHLLHATRTSALLQMSQILPRSSVPRRHVLLHAVGELRLLGGRDGRAGGGDRALEAVLVDFLLKKRNRQYLCAKGWRWKCECRRSGRKGWYA